MIFCSANFKLYMIFKPNIQLYKLIKIHLCRATFLSTEMKIHEPQCEISICDMIRAVT